MERLGKPTGYRKQASRKKQIEDTRESPEAEHLGKEQERGNGSRPRRIKLFSVCYPLPRREGIGKLLGELWGTKLHFILLQGAG